MNECRDGLRRCSVRPHTIRRPRLALGDGAATGVGFFAVLSVEAGEGEVNVLNE